VVGTPRIANVSSNVRVVPVRRISRSIAMIRLAISGGKSAVSSRPTMSSTSLPNISAPFALIIR
jgi:hypothetical protein